jgi:Asp-tRNA(Asn)/Glu-tRNA(Gln) amidotransferase B subunit
MVEFKGSFIQGSENTGFYHSANSSGISIEWFYISVEDILKLNLPRRKIEVKDNAPEFIEQQKERFTSSLQVSNQHASNRMAHAKLYDFYNANCGSGAKFQFYNRWWWRIWEIDEKERVKK